MIRGIAPKLAQFLESKLRGGLDAVFILVRRIRDLVRKLGISTALPTGFSFKVASPLGGFLKAETSTNRGAWTVLGTNRFSDMFLDTASRENTRFYRVRPFHAP